MARAPKRRSSQATTSLASTLPNGKRDPLQRNRWHRFDRTAKEIASIGRERYLASDQRHDEWRRCASAPGGDEVV